MLIRLEIRDFAVISNIVFEPGKGLNVISGETGAEADKGLIGEHGRMEFILINSNDGKFWFTLRELSASELEMAQIKANIAYTTMMSGVDLDE